MYESVLLDHYRLVCGIITAGKSVTRQYTHQYRISDMFIRDKKSSKLVT